MSDLNMFIRTADNMNELIADFNNFDLNIHTEDILEIRAEEFIELWGKVKSMLSRYMNVEGGLKKTRSESQEGK